MREHVLTVKQPWADLIMAGVKDVENRTWPVPSTLQQWGSCPGHGRVVLDYPPDGHIADDGPDTAFGHAPDCGGECRHCPAPVQIDPRYPCGPIEPDGPFPFRLWIHASKLVEVHREEKEAWGALAEHWLGKRAYAGAYHRALARAGALLGSVTVAGCHHADECREHRGKFRNVEDGYEERIDYCSRWAQPDQYHWELADPVPLDEPIPMRGRQKLWTLPADVAVPA